MRTLCSDQFGFPVGVYIASHGNPYFLRSALAQLYAQTLLPDVLAIHQNGYSSVMLVADLICALRAQDVAVDLRQTERDLEQPVFHQVALQQLLNTKQCTLFTKWDHDDIFRCSHLEELTRAYLNNRAACLIETGQDVLEVRPGGQPYLLENADWTWNPLGGMSDAVMFNREVALAYVEEMRATRGTPDDVILATVLSRFTVARVKSSTACYVAHGFNTSGQIWKSPEYRAQRMKQDANSGV